MYLGYNCQRILNLFNNYSFENPRFIHRYLAYRTSKKNKKISIQKFESFELIDDQFPNIRLLRLEFNFTNSSQKFKKLDKRLDDFLDSIDRENFQIFESVVGNEIAGATTLPRVSSDVTPRVTRAGIASGLIQNAIQDMTTISADGMYVWNR